MRGVDVDRIVRTVAHEVGVTCVMLDDAAAQDEHAALLAVDSLVVHATDVCGGGGSVYACVCG